MKNSRYLYYLFSSLSLIGCQSEFVMPENSWGHFVAKVNGRPWEKTYKNAFQAIRGYDERDSLEYKKVFVYSLLYDSEGVLEEELFLTEIPAKPGRYKVLPQNEYGTDSMSVFSSLTTFIDSDMFRDHYEVLDSEDNYLQIDQYQENGNREIKGRFNVTYVLRSKRSFNSYEDTLRFTNGRFHTKILQRIKRHL